MGAGTEGAAMTVGAEVEDVRIAQASQEVRHCMGRLFFESVARRKCCF